MNMYRVFVVLQLYKVILWTELYSFQFVCLSDQFHAEMFQIAWHSIPQLMPKMPFSFDRYVSSCSTTFHADTFTLA